ncbi:MAG: hypothetical protein FWC66_09620, partial [Oscillospiraceae bacterium]|nr:hypothetical protein [Oscillospiraceae bacterium]
VSSPYTSQNRKPSASPLTVCALGCWGLTNDFLFRSERVSSPYTSRNKKPSATPCKSGMLGAANDF